VEGNFDRTVCNQNETQLNSCIVRSKQGRKEDLCPYLAVCDPGPFPRSHGQGPMVPGAPHQQDTQAWLSSLPPHPLLKKERWVHSPARSQEVSQ